MTKRRLLKWAGLAAVLGLVAFAGVAIGIIPVAASSGHWALTHGLLDFAKRRSVALHARSVKAFPLNEEWMVQKGAGHYAFGCEPCHGRPDANTFARVMQAATPAPPYLPHDVSRWNAAELFYIAKHGIKFTGMPAWPAQERDDEVQAMAAFLVRLPSLSGSQYEALIRPHPGTPGSGDARSVEGMPTPEIVKTSCAPCHGADGGGRGLGAYPTLAGQRREYLNRALEAYASGARHSGTMEPLAVGLTAEVRNQLSAYYAALPKVAQVAAQDPASVERGREIAQSGIPAQRTPACVKCHGPKPSRVHPEYPSLAGQYPRYLLLQLQLFKQGHRGGGKSAQLMREAADELREDQMRDLAAYFASLPSEAE
ncbi:MAG: c-type cytochrome [Myxococcaceae bacterium]